ncbi:13088_t:CDS:2, partial [Racocetra persica]
LLQDDTEWDACFREASEMQTGQQLYHLFAHQNSNLSDVVENYALKQLEQVLLLNGKSLKDFPNMPLPTESIENIDI